MRIRLVLLKSLPVNISQQGTKSPPTPLTSGIILNKGRDIATLKRTVYLMLLHIRATGRSGSTSHKIWRAVWLVLAATLATTLLAAPDNSVPGRPPVPVIREQVADILSQPEYQQPDPTWLMRLLERVGELVGRLIQWLLSPVRGVPSLAPVFRWLTAGLLFLVLLALLYHILITIQSAFGRPRTARRAGKAPALLLASPATLRRQAAHLASQGDFAGALRVLYHACVRHLDQRGYLYYHPATTNGEYLWQVYEHPELTASLQPISRAMDRLCYAHVSLDGPTYKHLDTLAQQLWQEVEKGS